MMAFDDASDNAQRRDVGLESAANPADEHVRELQHMLRLEICIVVCKCILNLGWAPLPSHHTQQC